MPSQPDLVKPWLYHLEVHFLKADRKARIWCSLDSLGHGSTGPGSGEVWQGRRKANPRWLISLEPCGSPRETGHCRLELPHEGLAAESLSNHLPFLPVAGGLGSTPGVSSLALQTSHAHGPAHAPRQSQEERQEVTRVQELSGGDLKGGPKSAAFTAHLVSLSLA